MKKLDDDTINDMILQWHDSNSELPLHEYLGMSKKQYAKWIEKDIPKIKVITLFTYVYLCGCCSNEWRCQITGSMVICDIVKWKYDK